MVFSVGVFFSLNYCFYAKFCLLVGRHIFNVEKKFIPQIFMARNMIENTKKFPEVGFFETRVSVDFPLQIQNIFFWEKLIWYSNHKSRRLQNFYFFISHFFIDLFLRRICNVSSCYSSVSYFSERTLEFCQNFCSNYTGRNYGKNCHVFFRLRLGSNCTSASSVFPNIFGKVYW